MALSLPKTTLTNNNNETNKRQHMNDNIVTKRQDAERFRNMKKKAEQEYKDILEDLKTKLRVIREKAEILASDIGDLEWGIRRKSNKD